MYPKMVFLILFIAALALALLGLRQKRLETMHDSAELVRQMVMAKRDLWDLQTRAAIRTEPNGLLRAIDRASLQCEHRITAARQPSDLRLDQAMANSSRSPSETVSWD